MKKKILIIDDEVIILKSLKTLLNAYEYEVYTAGNSAEGLKILNQHKIQVLIADERMPGVGGSEFLLYVKEAFPATIRILLSGYTDIETLSAAINQGDIYKFIAKPWDDKLVVSVIKDAMICAEKLQEQIETSNFLDNAMESVAITDAQGLVQTVNKSFCISTKHDAKEIVGQKLQLIDEEFVDPILFNSIKYALLTTGYWQGELWCNKKNDERFLVFITIKAIRDRANITQRYTYSFIDISDKKEFERQLTFQAKHDMLTGLANREAFREELNDFCVQHEYSSSKAYIIFIDIDRFKYINDVLGNFVGDQTLVAIGNRLNDFINQGETVARLGNDEFAIMLKDPKGILDINAYLDTLYQNFDEPLLVEDNSIYIMASSGVSVFPQDGKSAHELMQNANTALSHARATGICKYQLFKKYMHQDANKVFLEIDIRNALKINEFMLYLQPKYSLSQNRIVGAEALVRWNHPKKGVIFPKQFIGLCEETGLIFELERQTINMVCALLKKWHEQYHLNFTISLNLSPKQFTRPDFLDIVNHAIKHYEIKPQQLELEVTEQLIHLDKSVVEKCMFSLHERGLRLAMDNFGIGYSSLGFLTQMPFDVIKIDQSFTRNMLSNSRVETIMFALIDLCKKLSFETVIEGVENKNQVNILKKHHCDIIQGYWVSRPIPEENFIELLNGQLNMFSPFGSGHPLNDIRE